MCKERGDSAKARRLFQQAVSADRTHLRTYQARDPLPSPAHGWEERFHAKLP